MRSSRPVVLLSAAIFIAFGVAAKGDDREIYDPIFDDQKPVPGVQLRIQYLLLRHDDYDLLRERIPVRGEVELQQREKEGGPVAAYLVNNHDVDWLLDRVADSGVSEAVAPPATLFVPLGQQGRLHLTASDDPTHRLPTRGAHFRGGATISDDRFYVNLSFRAHVTTAPREPDDPLWGVAVRTTVPDAATLLVVGDELVGTTALDSHELDPNDPRLGLTRRVVILVRPTIEVPFGL